MKKLALIAALALSFFLVGCIAGDQGAIGIAKSLPEVQAFLNSHPNSTIKTAYWSNATVNASIAQIRAQCGNQFEIASYYRVEFESQDLSLVAWVNEKTQRVDCSVTINKNGVVITPSPTVTSSPTPSPSPTPVCPAPPACPTPIGCPVITPPACPTPNPCPAIQPPVCPTPPPCPTPVKTSAVSEIRLLEPPGATTTPTVTATPTPMPTPGCPVVTPCPPISVCPTPFACPTPPTRICPTPRPCPTFPPRICPTPPPKPTKPAG